MSTSGRLCCARQATSINRRQCLGAHRAGCAARYVVAGRPPRQARCVSVACSERDIARGGACLGPHGGAAQAAGERRRCACRAGLGIRVTDARCGNRFCLPAGSPKWIGRLVTSSLSNQIWMNTGYKLMELHTYPWSMLRIGDPFSNQKRRHRVRANIYLTWRAH